jgi:putative membrane-bound dehydrogenase-like protein
MPLNYNCRWLAVCVLCGFCFSAAAIGQEIKPNVPDTIDKDYSAELPRIEPFSPAEALKSFEIAPGFQLQQVAAEPLVADPIAICFDENSRMYVVEMRGYSENRDEKLSRIKLLEDTDDDGKFDKATAFADQLNWPTAIHCWKGGVFVADAPDLLYLKDINGDGVADEKKVVLTGFGTSNVQGLVNTFQWSLDNRIDFAISSSGAVLTNPNNPNSKPLTIRGRDLALDPETMELTPITGGAQHGATTDQWGNRFVCSNSDHIQHCVFEDRYLARNPYLAVSNARRSIAADGPQADVFRISPLEPWRIVRTRLRVNKIVPGIVEGGGRPSGYFTSATGVTIYTGDAWPAEHVGTAFVGDVGSNIVHRKRLKPNGVSFTAERIDEKKEFIASRDTWFRPVQFANAPDGCLYICDMYRETIEHPLSIPPILKKHLDLTSGRDRGRIYRVVHEKSTLRTPLPKLGELSRSELLRLLDHPNGWHRETAARLIHERGPAELRQHIATYSLVRRASPAGQIGLLSAISGLGLITADELLPRLTDEHPRVREHAIRHAEKFAADSTGIRNQLLAMTKDDDLRVRFQLAFTLGVLPAEQRVPALLQLWQRDAVNADMRAAILTSLGDGAGLMLQQLASDAKLADNETNKQFVLALTSQIGKQQRPEDVALLIQVLVRWSEQKSPLLALAVQNLGAKQGSPLAEQIAKATGGKADEWLREMVSSALVIAKNEQASVEKRVAAVRQLRFARLADISATAEELLSPTQPAELQTAAIALLGSSDTSDAAKILVARFDQFSPALKSRALDALCARDTWSLLLLEAVENKTIPAADIEPTRWKLLSESVNAEVKKRATTLAKANTPTDRLEVLTGYRSTLQATGDAIRGKEVFKKNCAACHKLQGVGHELGPNLAAMKNRGAEAILVNVLDPNREVNPQYLNYLLLTADGRSLSGVLSAETATSVTLRKQENVSETVLRVDIENLKSTGQSLMPVGMEKQIDKAAMADLLEYLKTVE